MMRLEAKVGSAVGSVDISYERSRVLGKHVVMPKRYPPEFKRDVVAVARRGDLSVAEIAVDFDIAPESVRRWMKQADVDDGIVAGQTSSEQAEVAQLRRNRTRDIQASTASTWQAHLRLTLQMSVPHLATRALVLAPVTPKHAAATSAGTHGSIMSTR